MNVALCSDTYSRCSLWTHRCDNKAIQGLCARTCGICQNNAIPVIQRPVQVPVPVIQRPVQPVQVQQIPVQVIEQPVQKPLTPAQPVNTGEKCVDTFSRCHNWVNECGNRAIKGFCAKTCGVCSDAIVEPAKMIVEGPLL